MNVLTGHRTDVYIDTSASGTQWWRARCACGWKSSRYRTADTAERAEQHHLDVVAAGDWNGPGAA